MSKMYSISEALMTLVVDALFKKKKKKIKFANTFSKFVTFSSNISSNNYLLMISNASLIINQLVY